MGPNPNSVQKRSTLKKTQSNQQTLSNFFEPALNSEKSKEPSKQAESSTSKEPSTDLRTKTTAPTTQTRDGPQTITLTNHIGDIFAAPQDTVLIHACNTQGSWGAGIAAAFRARYPAAYKVYRGHCVKTHDPVTDPVPTGTCLLIPPCENSSSSRRHWVACLFTSAKYGKAKDKPDVILANTGPAMKQLLEQLRGAQGDGKEVSGLRMCKINSARFGVPWGRTVAVLEGLVVGEGEFGQVEVWDIE